MSTRLFQYAKSADPEVVRVTLANRDGRNAFAIAADEWAKERGGKALMTSAFGRYMVAGLSVQPEGRGRWTCGRGAWRPFKNNRAEHAAMSAISFTNARTPGLPELIVGPMNHDWSRPFASPRPFVYEGVAYLGLSFIPSSNEPENKGGYGPQWTEILPSEFHAANEALTGRTVAS